MTIVEKIEMYKGKKAFVEAITNLFRENTTVSTVDYISYEVYQHTKYDDMFTEFVVLHFKGGSISPLCVTGNSNIANFRLIGSAAEGGYYGEVPYYESLEEKGYRLIELDSDQFKLDDLLKKPMTHITDVHKCFSYCKDASDVERVISAIPFAFGCFTVEYSEDYESFTILQEWVDENGSFSEECDFSFI